MAMQAQAMVVPQRTVGVVAKHSVHFVQTVFEAFAQGDPVVLLRGVEDERVQRAGVTRVVDPQETYGWYKPVFGGQESGLTAQIAFTSGTEGEPKGVILTHGNLADTVARLNEAMELSSEVREYVGVPVHYSFGMGRCRAVAAVGGSCYIPQYGFNPAEIRELLERGEINAISAVPSLWRVLIQGADAFGRETRAVRWIEIGSQAMDRTEKEALKTLFPNANIVQHYGLTEASRSTFLRIDRAVGLELESVGQAVGGTELAIAADGRILIRGPHVAQQLLLGNEVVSNVDAEGWLHTNDQGRLEDGLLYFEGRSDDVINCGGIKLSPDQLEERLRAYLGRHSGFAVAGIPLPLVGQGVLIAIERSAGLNPEVVVSGLRQVLESYGVSNRSVIRQCELDALPTTATGKVQRKKLAAHYADGSEWGDSPSSAQHGDPAEPHTVSGMRLRGRLSEQEAVVAEVWQETLGLSEVDPDRNFYELGGDSLTALTAVMALERRQVPSVVSKSMLQGLTVRETAARMAEPEQVSGRTHTLPNDELRAAMAINMVRGLLVLAVIFAHWAPGVIERLPASLAALDSLLSPVFAVGTPGFAIVYGVSVGFSLFPSFLDAPDRFQAVQRRARLLLAAGVLALAVVLYGAKVALGEAQTLTDLANAFYTVITYYLLATLTLPLWLRLVARSRQPAALVGLLGVLLLTVYYYVFLPLDPLPTTGFVELAKMLLTAKYAYANMLGGTFLGMATGLWLREAIQAQRAKQSLALAGVGAVCLGVMTASVAGVTWFQAVKGATRLWQWWVYLGVVALTLYGSLECLRGYNRFGAVRLVTVRACATFGVLAFPLYITHSAVIPLKDILSDGLGIPAGIALLASMGLFVMGTGLLFRRIYDTSFR